MDFVTPFSGYILAFPFPPLGINLFQDAGGLSHVSHAAALAAGGDPAHSCDLLAAFGREVGKGNQILQAFGVHDVSFPPVVVI